MRILECTLRDGSYANNFQFTARDTAVIVAALDQAGFDLIEVGHGVGLNASESGMGQAAETDASYLLAASGATKRAKFGVFCIPGIARMQDLEMAIDHGIGFIRIGTNVTEVRDSEPFIVRAKEHGLFVCANFMKSYATDPADFAQQAKRSQSYGADVVYLVDSAGGMLPGDVERYVRAVHDACDVAVAFHGHDNLGLAMANSLRAAEVGASIIDSSLQGMGRSAGNTVTEMLVVSLERMGFDLGIDPIEVMDIGEKLIRPRIHKRGHSSLDIVTGQAQFHSSYMDVIRRYSSQYGVDPRRLILGVAEEDKVNAPAELVERVAQRLEGSTADEVLTARYGLAEYFGHEQDGQG